MSAGPQLISLGEHPRAALAIRRAKARAGLAGFALVALAGLMHGAPLASVLGRALVGGIVANVVVWAVALVAWRRLLGAQATAAVRQSRERAEEQRRVELAERAGRAGASS